MAATVTANLSLVSDADSASAQGTWLGNSGGQDLEVKVQGSASYTWQASKNNRTSCTFTPTTNLDMSATGVHLYWWAKNDVAPFMEAKTTGTTTNSGYTIRLADSSGNYIEWHIAGSDTWQGEWRCFVLDLANTSEIYASSGTLDLSDIDVITFYVDISNSGNIRIIDNQWNDVIRFGTGLTITGTDFDLVDIAAIDENSSNRYGILENIDGVVFSQGKLTIGNGATTTTFNSTDEALIFRDRIGQGSGIVASGFYELNFVGSGCVADIAGLVVKGAGSTDVTRPVIDASDTNADVTFDGVTVIHAGLIDFAAGNDIQNSKFSDCLQITPSTATFKYNTIANFVGTDGAVLFPSDGANIANLNFINCDNGVEYDSSSDSTSPTFDAFIFDDVSGNYDVNNTSGGSISIAKTNQSNPNSYNPGGSAVTFTASYILTVKGLELNTEVTIVTAGTTTVLHNTENASVSDGDGKYQIQYTHSGGASVDVLIHHVSYKPDISNVYGVTLPNNASEIKVTMFSDENYYNPS